MIDYVPEFFEDLIRHSRSITNVFDESDKLGIDGVKSSILSILKESVLPESAKKLVNTLDCFRVKKKVSN